MIGAVFENIIGGYLHPRASVRRLLARRPGIDAAIAMVVLAYLLYEIFFIIVPGGRPDDLDSIFVYYLLGLVQSLIMFGLYAFAIYHIGRLFGGRASFEQTALVVSWFLVVTSPIRGMAAPSAHELRVAFEAAAESPSTPAEVPGDAMMVLLATGVVMLWLLSSYIAELHGFARTWQVLAALLGFSILFSVVFSGLMTGV